MKFGSYSFLTCIVLFTFGNIINVSGQNSAPVVKGVKIGEKFYEMRERASELARIREELNKPEERKAEPSFPQIKKDFEKLQIVNTEKLQAKSSVNSLNYKLINNASQEIKSRAYKIRTNLFPTDKSDIKNVKIPENLSAEDFMKIIIALDNTIYHFVSSPIFQNTKLVKPEDSEYAQKELNRIILLSHILEMSAEKLK